MKIVRNTLFAWLIGSIVLGAFLVDRAGTNQPTTPAVPNVIIDVLDPALTPYAAGWQKEIARRFPDAVGVLCHGRSFIHNEWIVSAQSFGHLSTAQDVVAYEKARYPGKVIVLLCCNPDHLDLGISGVYFARDSVWCIPDRAMTNTLTYRMALYDVPDAYCPRDMLPSPKHGVVMDGPAKSRWEEDPGVVGNIFEFIED